MSEYLNEMIGFNVQGTAEWRRRKADDFPDDPRNVAAAEQLDRLGEQIDGLNGSDIEIQIRKLAEAVDSSGWLEISETVSAELRSIGFHNSYDASGLLEWFRDLLKEKRHALDAVQESRVRRKAARQGYRVHKSREWKHVPHSNNYGEYMLLDDRNNAILGWNYDAILDDIESYLDDVIVGTTQAVS